MMAEREPLLGANIVTLSICYQHLAAKINRRLEPLKLNMTQLSILTRFARMPSDHAETITNLSQVMEMNQPMVTKAVKAMHRHGLIEKRAGIEDARVSHLYLTDEGRALLLQAQLECLPSIEEAYADLSTDELVQLLGLLSRVKERLL